MAYNLGNYRRRRGLARDLALSAQIGLDLAASAMAATGRAETHREGDKLC
jgi:hypothetical protein